MPPKRSKKGKQPATVAERGPIDPNARGLVAMPAELFNEMAKYLKGVDVLNLGCANQRLSQLTDASSHLWRRLRESLGYPAPPANGGTTDKRIVALVSRGGLVCQSETRACTVRAKSVNWMLLKRLCAKCSGSALLLNGPDEAFFDWALRMRNVDEGRIITRSEELQQLRDARRADIVARCAALPFPISIATLRQCDAFNKAANVASALTDRMFSNLLNKLGPQVKAVRVQEEIRNRYNLLRAAAFEGIPEPWNAPSRDLDFPYFLMAMMNMLGGPIGSMGSCRKELVLRETLEEKFENELEDMVWDDEFPTFDMGKYLETAKETLCEPYQSFQAERRNLISKYAHLEGSLTDEAIGVCQMRTLKSIFSSNSDVSFLKHESKTARFYDWFKGFIIKKRLSSLFADVTITTAYFAETDHVKTNIFGFGLTEWFKRNEKYFDHEVDNWNQEAMEGNAKAWMDTVAKRFAITFRHLINLASRDILESQNTGGYENFEAEVRFITASSEWTGTLHDSPNRAVRNIFKHLAKLFASVYCTQGHTWSNRDEFTGVRSMVDACRDALIGPDIEAAFDADAACACVEALVAEMVLQERAMTLRRAGAAEGRGHELWVAEEFLKGVDGVGLTHDFDPAEHVKAFDVFGKALRERVGALVVEVQELNEMGEYFVIVAKRTLMAEISGTSRVKDHEQAKILLADLSPHNTEFDVTAVADKYNEWLNDTYRMQRGMGCSGLGYCVCNNDSDEYDSDADFY